MPPYLHTEPAQPAPPRSLAEHEAAALDAAALMIMGQAQRLADHFDRADGDTAVIRPDSGLPVSPRDLHQFYSRVDALLADARKLLPAPRVWRQLPTGGAMLVRAGDAA